MKKSLIIFFILISISALFAVSGLRESIISGLQARHLDYRLITVIISMLPIIELRGAIPVAILAFNMPWYEAVGWAVLGNMLPIPFLIIIIGWLDRIAHKSPWLRKILDKLFARTRKKGKSIETYKEIGLTLFVAVPLPVTGAWTGAMACYLFGLKFWKSMFCIFLGVIIASAIMTLLSLAGKIAV
ncbi:MAG: small multi-drug export protein [Candidatus Cloacimonetes bacterium]|nr:small multi-drug export protein [Candidatus Cloacimonadota bacterium]